MNPHQRELFLPERSADEIIRSKLEDAVAEFNAAEGDHERRCLLHAEIRRLRRLLRLEGA